MLGVFLLASSLASSVSASFWGWAADTSSRRVIIRGAAMASAAIPAKNVGNGFLTRARAIVLLMNPTADGIPDPSLIRDVLGVTLGEARIAALVGSGLSPKDAAERLGIAEETARSVLKRVFSKVGVSRQSELAAMMARLVIK